MVNVVEEAFDIQVDDRIRSGSEDATLAISSA